MKKLLVATLLLCTFSAFAQKKKVYFYDENDAPTSKNAFWKDKNDRGKLHLKLDLDSATVHVKVKRENRGTIPVDELTLIRHDLTTTSGKAVDLNNIIVVDYYPGDDACNAVSTPEQTKFIKEDRKKYLVNLHQLAPVAQFDIYNPNEKGKGLKGLPAGNPDLNDRIRKTFFKYHYPCGSVVIIRPDGQYIAYYGEYSKEQVLGYVKELNSK